MNIWIASDHAGFKLKEQIFKKFNKNIKYEFHDLGCYSNESCDYPKFAKRVCEKVVGLGGFGILICKTGQGMCMTANAQNNIRAALVYNLDSARLSREHNNANVICIGSMFSSYEQTVDLIQTFIDTSFNNNDERHIRRINQIN